MVKINSVFGIRKLTQKQQKVFEYIKSNPDEVYAYDEMEQIGKEKLGIKGGGLTMSELYRMGLLSRLRQDKRLYYQVPEVIEKIKQNYGI